MIYDDSANRFASLDSDKYGKISLMSSQQGKLAYSQGLTINGSSLPFKGHIEEILQPKCVCQVFRSILHLNVCVIQYNNTFKLITI